jgi:hypothetical protein
VLKKSGKMLIAVMVAAVLAGTGVGAANAQPVATVSASASSVDIVALESAYRAVASPQDYKLALSAYNSLVTGTATSQPALASTATSQPALASTATSQPALAGTAARVDLQVCVSIPKWAVVAYAWYVIVGGGATAIVGGFLDATILGLSAGAVLNAIGIGTGITGTALLYWTDHTSWPKRIACIGW